MMSATVPISYFIKAVPVHGKMPGTPEKATARAAPRKWSSRRGGSQGRDGDAVCAEVCRPSCRWAKARRQKVENGGWAQRRKKGQGAEDRRWLRRRLEKAEARVAALQEERRQLRRVMRRRDEQEKEEQECEQEYEMSRIDGRVVGHACGVDGALAGGLHLGAGGPLNSHSGPIGTSGHLVRRRRRSRRVRSRRRLRSRRRWSVVRRVI